MRIRDFEMFIKEVRMVFKSLLNGDSYDDESVMKKTLREWLNECCSEFEEKTLEENLKDVFSAHLEDLKKGA